METDFGCYVETWLEHIRVLADEIGPRGSTTEGERLAAQYCQTALARLGLAPRIERFESARSIYEPHVWAAGALLLAFAIYPLFGRASALVAALLSAAAVGSELLELSFRDNPIRRLIRKGSSQNVVAVLPPSGQHRQDLILIGHIDSHRTPLVFSSRRWLGLYQRFTIIAFVAFVLQVALYIAGTVTQSAWIWPASMLPASCALGVLLLCLQADRTPYNAGANDNASAAGLLLTLAGHLRAQPPQHTRIWFACTGCEEVQHYGAADFFRRHRSGMWAPQALIFEMLGCAGPAWLMREGIVVPFEADRRLVELASEISSLHPEWGGHPTTMQGGNTEMADALRANVPALTITGVTREGEAPYWHQAEDTYDKIDPEVLARTYEFVWRLIEALDRRTFTTRTKYSLRPAAPDKPPEPAAP